MGSWGAEARFPAEQGMNFLNPSPCIAFYEEEGLKALYQRFFINKINSKF
jgi:hypothetical protein